MGMEITKGMVRFTKGRFPDHAVDQGPPFIDESELTEDELEYLWRVAD